MVVCVDVKVEDGRVWEDGVFFPSPNHITNATQPHDQLPAYLDVRMRALLLLFIGKAMLSASTWRFGGGEEDVRVPEVVYGLELTLTGAHCAISIPSGNTTGLASIEGDAAYIALMQEWMHIAGSKDGHLRARELYPLPYHFRPIPDYNNTELQYTNPWWIDRMWRKLPDAMSRIPFEFTLEDFAGDQSTAILESNIRRLRNVCFAKVRYDMKLWQPDATYAEVALPIWLYKELPYFDKDDLKKYPHLGDLKDITSTPFCSLTSRISTAVQRVGFSRSIYKSAKELLAAQIQDIHRVGPPNAAYMTATTAMKGTEDRIPQGQTAHAHMAVLCFESVADIMALSVWVSNTTTVMSARSQGMYGIADSTARTFWIDEKKHMHDSAIVIVYKAILELQHSKGCSIGLVSGV